MKKQTKRTVLFSSGITVLTIFLFLYGQFHGIENRSIDFRFKIRGDLPRPANISIITADEKSIEELGRWPWPRHYHAKIIELLTVAKAKAIVFDVLFTEPDLDRPWSDKKLAESAEKSGKVAFGMLFRPGEDGFPSDPLFPIEKLYGKNVETGLVNFFPDMVDGVCRQVPLWVDYMDRKFPALSLASLSIAENKTPEQLLTQINPSVEGIWNEMNINFVGGFQSFPYYSYVDVFKERTELSQFKDKIVLIGGTATALFDFKAVPNVNIFPGLEIHANALDNLIKKRFLHHIHPIVTLLIILLFGLVSGFLATRAPVWAGAASLGLLLGYYIFCQILFSHFYLQLDFVAPTFCILGSYAVVFFYRFLTESKEKRWIKGTFSQYMSPKIVNVLMSDPDRLKLGGEERPMTILFSDLAGFTTISEAMSAPELVNVLNEYLTKMSDVILKHDGVVDKYIGDAIMAFWNAPLDQEGHAKLACFAALEQMKQLKTLQKNFLERGLPLIDCRIGINTGSAVVGNMGSHTRFDYTVMGDTVNLASRLEGANKSFATQIMISESTYEQVKNDIEVRRLDLLRVKGKKVPIKVYELLAKKDDLPEDTKKAMKLYQEGLNLYRYSQFQKAQEKFKKTLSLLPNDGPSKVYLKRCEEFLINPPQKDWDGVYVMTTK